MSDIERKVETTKAPNIQQVSRRRFLQFSALTAASGILAACGGKPESQPVSLKPTQEVAPELKLEAPLREDSSDNVEQTTVPNELNSNSGEESGHPIGIPQRTAEAVSDSTELPESHIKLENELIGKEFVIIYQEKLLDFSFELEKNGNGEGANAVKEIANQPMAEWFNGDLNDEQRMNDLMAGEDDKTRLAVLYNHVLRDGNGESKGGVSTWKKHQEWIEVLNNKITKETVVVLSPDLLGDLASGKVNGVDLTDEETQGALEGMKQSIDTLKSNPKVHLYMAISGWPDSEIIAKQLNYLGIDHVALNVSGYEANKYNIAILEELKNRIPTLRAVVDTSRNGIDIGQDKWQNEPEAGIGEYPQVLSGDAIVDAYLWIKKPQESDGEFDGKGLPAGAFDKQHLMQMIDNNRKINNQPSLFDKELKELSNSN